MTLYLFVKTGQGSIVTLLHQTAEKWRRGEGRLPSYTDVLAEDRHVQATDDRAPWPPNGCSQGSGGDGKGEEAQLGGRTRPLASSEVESTETRTTSGRGQTNGADRRPVEADRRATKGDQRGGLAPVQELQEDDRSANHGMDAVSPGDLIAPTRGPGVEHIAELGGTRGVAPAGLPTAAGEATVQRPCGPSTAGLLDPSRELSLNAVLKLSLYNRSNLCYLNTSVLATTWAVLQLQRHGTTDLALHSCFHALASGSTRPAATQVAQLLQWRLLLGQWPQLGRQHDICEFLNYLVPRCLRWAHGALIPKWEARRHRNGHLCVLDSGTTHLPLPIPLCSGEVCHLQWCVDAWHQQGLLRFHNEDGVMRRDSRPLQGHLATVHMPIFQDASEEMRNELRCTYASYQVVSMALHFGESPNEGHYQAILNGQPFFGGNKRWLTDDNRPARVHTCETDAARYRSAIYVVWLRHEPGLDAV